MENTNNTIFIDSPDREQMISVIDGWRKPEISESLKNLIPVPEQVTFLQLSVLFRKKLAKTQHARFKKQLEKWIINWLYNFIRLNIKRGRVFDLREVLKTGYADCLGYAKIFITLGRCCGLDLGVIEVIMDNRGRNVPHTTTLVILPDGQFQFIDFWYGSKNIQHQRLGLRVKHGEEWRIKDIDYKDLKKVESVSYLPDYCMDAITLYIEGNRYLKNRDYFRAVKRYSKAIRLYPENSRTFYNRAIAYENLGELKRAKADYTRALQDNASLPRTLATQPEDIVDLIRLDEENVPEQAQQIYLLHEGFITGKKVAPCRIARKTGLSIEEIKHILDSIYDNLAIRAE